MKKTILIPIIIILILAGGILLLQEKNPAAVPSTPPVPVVPAVPIDPLPAVYSSTSAGFSIHLPSLVASADTADGYVADSAYTYQELGPGQTISGIKFTIPASLAAGTNLSPDSYISVEQIPNAAACSAALFTEPGTAIKTVTDNGTTYSEAMTGDAAAGNRYDETVYALPGTNPCVAVRYYIHYGAFDNYPAGTVTQFDEPALVAQFDQIRRTLVLNQ